jgi:hypothetical protein
MTPNPPSIPLPASRPTISPSLRCHFASNGRYCLTQYSYSHIPRTFNRANSRYHLNHSPSSSPSPSPAPPAGQTRNHNIEHGDDTGDNGVENSSDSVDDRHQASSYGSEYIANLFVVFSLSGLTLKGGREEGDYAGNDGTHRGCRVVSLIF